MGLDFKSWSDIKTFFHDMIHRPGIENPDKEITNFLLHSADEASYLAKESGRARAYLHGHDAAIYIYDGPVSQAVLDSRIR
jgi:hypothetical protein